VSRNAIVTLAVGAAYEERFEQFCRRNWTAYAQRHGFDLVVFKRPLDGSERARARSPAWQKCLVLGAPETAGYDRVVWIDSDILINPAAPSILDGVPEELIGVMDEHRFPTPQARVTIIDGIIGVSPETGEMNKRFWQAWREPGAWHQFCGLPGGQAHIVQTGVMVLSPKHHRPLLEHVYRAYDDRGGKSFNYEMRPLSHEVQRQRRQHWIDPRFNVLVWWLFLFCGVENEEPELRRFVQDCYRQSYFLHFAGAAHLMPMLDSVCV
jgi:hypothetical protein